VSDGIRQQFTLKERDIETGLDYFGARYYASTHGRFTSPDNIAFSKGTNPQTWNLYAYTSNNPLNRVDKNGRDWFQIGDGYGARFEWYEGKKHKYRDADGKEQKAKNVGRYLLVVVKTGQKNSDNAEIVRITLYDQNKVAAQNSQGFSAGEPGSQPIPTGVYHMNLYLRSDAKDNDNDGYLDKNAGLQTVPPEAQGSWGTRRAALEPWSDHLDTQYVGNYLHGHLKEKSTTIGCVCDRSETVIDAVFNINSRETPRVRAVVTDGLPKSGDPKPGPYVIFPE